MGFYGHGNLGDELILQGLKELFNDWQVQPYTNDGYGAYPEVDFDMVNKCDLFVLGGGELINSRWLWMPKPCMFKPRTKLYRLYARTPFSRRSWINQVRIRKVVLGCGVDVEKPEELRSNVVHDLERFSYIGLRDYASIEILKSFPQLCGKVHLFYDLAFAINAELDVITYLAKVFPIKLHGLILSHMANVPYKFHPYHRKVKRVHDTIANLTTEEIRRTQKARFLEMLDVIA